ncbi:putative leucine carboxyl methyltransferase [Colletotrichum karsti]|uniref:tRNA wybutosine-synthesizing protein 4 n=1 Tax=Colletotrichum karsti TaxID=1095194 RepID=A0A9P6HUF2_9PEZI|nr:putative leucine carboxyl methyltransferase [Colletotrichum karsti]KAF9870544.1 putative leucine carboxyl methyltransferase [Colletotrichum karsti]
MATAVQNVRRTQALDDLIMATNSSSITSKRSVERIYYPDEPHYFRFFVKKFQRRAPLINRGYHLRLKVIDTLVRRFLEKPSSLKKVVVNLGCGSDVLPWQCEVRYPEACQNVTFVDVDYPDLIEKKRRIVVETPELREILGTWEVSDKSPVVLQSQKYCQVGCDLRRLSTLGNSLSNLFDLSKTEFLFVAEVSITYMDTEGADGVIKWAGTIENAEFCLLEQILPDGPDHPFAHTMLKHFNKLNTPIKSVHRYPTVSSQEDRFATLGWPKVESWTLWEAWADELFMTSMERKALDAVEPFDEWEEFALFASHYVVILGSTQGRQEHAHLSLKSEDSGIKSYQTPMSLSAYDSSRGRRRFGAAMLVDKPDGQTIVSHVLGQGPNGRLNSEDSYQISSHRSPSSAPRNGPSGRVCHTLTDLGNVGVLLVGGRTSPSTAFQDCWLRRKVFNTWERVQDLPLSLFRHSVTRLGTSFLALLVGGRSNHPQTSASCLLFDPSRGWTPCSTQSAPPALCGAILTCIGSSGFGKYEGILAGGLLADGLVNQDTYIWSLDTSGPEPLIIFENIGARIKQRTANLLSRFGSTATLVKGYVLIFGGVVKDVQLPAADDILVLKVAHRDVEIVAKVDGISSAGILRPFLVGSSVVSYGDGNIAIVGGGATCFSMGTCWTPGSYSLTFEADRLWEHNKSPLYPHALPPVKYLETVEITRTDAKQNTELSAPATLQPIPRVKIESKEQFQSVLDEGNPVVIVGSDIGCCKSTWSPEYLVDSVGPHREVSIHESATEKMDFNAKNFRYVTKKFADFIEEARNGKRLYMRALSNEEPSNRPTQLSEDYPSLAKDFTLPSQLAFVSDNTFSSVLRISGPVNMWLHYDVMANVYVQVVGSKRLILFPPSDVTQFSFAPGASSSSVDVFSSLESDSLRGVHPHEALLTPGDILFLPPLWLHTATPTSQLSVAVNVFFRNLQKGYSVGRDVYGNRDLAAYEKGRQDIARLRSGFSKLPPDARDFYLRRLADELLQSIKDV